MQSFSLLLFILIFVFAAVKKPLSLPITLGTSLLVTLLTRIPVSFIVYALKAPILFVIMMSPTLILSAGGEHYISLGPLRFYTLGFELAGRIAVKVLSIMLIFIALFGTCRLHITMKAMESFKIPSSLLVIFLFTYRYIFLYIEDLKKVFTAARLIGYTLQRGIDSIRSAVNVLVTLLIRSYEQSDRVYSAMRLRGFDSSYKSTTEFKLTVKDILKSLVFAALCILLVIWEVL